MKYRVVLYYVLSFSSLVMYQVALHTPAKTTFCIKYLKYFLQEGDQQNYVKQFLTRTDLHEFYAVLFP